MTDTRKASLSIPINAKQEIRPTGEFVTRTNWKPEEGLSRNQEIEQAREKALEEHQRQVENATTVGQRLTNLENLVVQLQSDITKLYQLLGQR
jgi:hypothetical protein